VRASLIVLCVSLAAVALGCPSDPAPPPTRAINPEIEAVEAPVPAIEGSLLRVTGAALDLAGRAAELEVREGDTSVTLAIAPGYARGERFFLLDRDAVDTLGSGSHAVEAILRGNGRESDPFPFDLEIATELPVQLDALLEGDKHYNDVEIIRGEGYIAPGEGTLEAHFTGTFTRETGGSGVPIDVSIPVIQAERNDRGRGVVMLRTALGTAEPGTFVGEMELQSDLVNGVSSTSAAIPVDIRFREPIVFRFDPPTASLGEYVVLTGAGFLGAPPLPGDENETTEVVLEGTFTPFEGGAGTPIPSTAVVPRWISGSEVRIEISTRELDGELVSFFFGARRGTFSGMARIRVGKGTVNYEGPPVPVSFDLAPVRQVVYLSFLPGFYDALALFGLSSAAGEIEERIKARIEDIYRGYNVEIRLDPPDDFSPNGYAKVEIGGTDPNGVGLFGYDNTPGKDINNLRLFDQIGGTNAETQADGSPGYGGVFVESLLWFSTHPELGERPPSSPPPDPLFDQIFDPVRQRSATLDEIRGIGEPERIARVQRALDALANIIGETTSHELGHSLGLSQPYGSMTAYHSAIPGEGCLMDSGSDRPLGERAGEPDFAEPHFCGDEPTYLFEILGD
jgi:hypothetical protein